MNRLTEHARLLDKNRHRRGFRRVPRTEIRQNGKVAAFSLSRAASNALSFERPLAEGAKVTFDVVPNRGNESAENLRIGCRRFTPGGFFFRIQRNNVAPN